MIKLCKEAGVSQGELPSRSCISTVHLPVPGSPSLGFPGSCVEFGWDVISCNGELGPA